MLKGLIKRLGKSPITLFIISHLAATYMRLVYHTTWWKVDMDDTTRDLISEGKPLIFAFWHGRMLMYPPYWHAPSKVRILVSHHRDGGLIDAILKRFGLHTVRGSSSRGGSKAIREILDLIESGISIGITPDGPRGPRMRFQGKAAEIARRSNTPIVTTSYSTSRCRFLNSWDRFLLPLPFATGTILVSAPHYIHEDTPPDDIQKQLEHELNTLTTSADEWANQSPIQPGEVSSCS